MRRDAAIGQGRRFGRLWTDVFVPGWAICVLAGSAGCGDPGVVEATDAPVFDGGLYVVLPDASLHSDTAALDGATSESGAVYGPDGSCGTSPFSASNRAVSILLVIDRSGSMAEPYGADQSKWTVLQLALATALDAAKKSISFGLELFPYSDDPNPYVCALAQGSASIQVPVGPGETTVPQILARLQKEPAGGTPTAAALANAYDFFVSGEGQFLAGDKYVLLATDGGPNCNANHAPCDATTCTTNLDGQCPAPDGGAPPNCCELPNNLGVIFCVDDQETANQLARLAAAGIKTFVIGLPGTEAYASYLDAFAAAGGGVNPNAPPLYFKVDASGGVAGLAAVFSSITKELITTCRFQLAADPPDVNLLNVEIDGVPIPQLGPDGWVLDTSTSPPTVVIKGATCEQVQIKGAESAQIIYGCPTYLIP
ncbi:MAG: VWA domain-containing protein [Deltaproteobacteria bacterium]|nr:VWA domain-containing protein [Deltaproteobacteria bacterium]